MKTLLFTCSSIGCLGLATMALADGPGVVDPIPTPMPPIASPTHDWSGAYAGLSLGYAVGNAVHSYSNGAPTGDSNPSGGLIGGFAGFARQSGSVVFGAEIDGAFSDFSGSFVDASGATSQGVISAQWQGSLRGVLGHAGMLGSRPAMFYATAGLAAGQFDFLGGPSVPVPPAGGYSDLMNGWTVGLGVNIAVRDNAALRVEYRYTDFGTANGTLAPSFPGVTMPVDVVQHLLQVGYRVQF